MSVHAAVLVPKDSTWRYFKGYSEASSPDRTAWRLAEFDDSSWPSGAAAFYYETSGAVAGQTVLSDMRGNYTCIFLRKTFVVTNIHDVASLRISALSDDGFIAWINGQEVMRYNVPAGELAYTATASSAAPEPTAWRTNVIVEVTTVLTAVTNVFCVQAFNVNKSDSSDFIINPALDAVADTFRPVLTMVYPPPGTTVRRLTSVETAFDEPVQGIDAADLLINGQPATGLTIVSPSQYIFTFPQSSTGVVPLAWAPGHGIRDLSSVGNPFVGTGWSCTLDTNAPIADVIISEFLASNSGDQPNSLKDELGESPDWIEIHNPGTIPVSLTGWSLTDDAARLTRWKFPPTLIPSGGYLVVFASGRDTNVAGRLHTNFKLSAGSSYLALVDPATNIVSAFSPLYPPQYTDVSYGRDLLEPALTGYFTNTTPEAANAVRGEGFGPEVRFSRAGGTFIAPFWLELSTPTPEWDIRYVLVTNNVPSGSLAITNIPTLSSPLYIAPIYVNGPVQVRARAFPRTSGFWPGPPRTECFLSITAAAAGFVSDLPIIVLHNLGGGAVPQTTDQSVIAMVFEPIDGVASMTNPPTLVSRAGLNIRGSSTAGLPQSSFALELWDEYNQDREVSLLGLPPESDWVLFGQNGFDPSFLHNPLMHQLSRDAGRYSPRTRFAEVFLNTSTGIVAYYPPVGGHYFGLYTVMEKIKRDGSRVDIAKLEPEQATLPDVTGGYLLKIDRADSDERTFTDSFTQRGIIYQDPPGLEMVDAARQAQRNYISSYFNQLGTVLSNPAYTNPVTGYAAYIDVSSWLDHHVLNLLAFNVDAMRLSGFFFKDRDKKIEMGPLWDFDRSLGTYHPSAGYGDARCYNPRVWRLQGTGDQGTDFFYTVPTEPGLGVRWWGPLFKDPNFWQGWIDRWSDLRQGVFSTNHVFNTIDGLAAQIRKAQPRQQMRWSHSVPRSGTLSASGYYHAFNGVYNGEIAFLKRWLGDRMHFLDTNFLGAPRLSLAAGNITPGQGVTITPPTVPANTRVYFTLDGNDPRLPGGAIAPTAQSSLGPVTVYLPENARVFARAWSSSHANMTNNPGAVGGNPPISSPWSAPAVATYVVTTPPIAITEIMYHPSGPDAGDFEYVELKNVGTQGWSLVGMRFTSGIDFVFSSTNAITMLSPGQYCVLVKNQAAFQARYPEVTNIAGQFSGSLDNSGERLALQGKYGEPVLDFRFEDAVYPVTDGLGFSLVIRNEAASFETWTNMANWRASSQWLGSPGRADPAPEDIPSVVINETLTHTDPPQMDTVELYNPTSTDVDLAGWFLSDDAGEPAKYCFPLGTTISAGGYLLVTDAEFGIGATGFGLSSQGEAIYLFSGDGTAITGYRHGFAFGAQANGVTFGRHVTGDGREHFVTESAASLRSANAGPKVGPIVINEIMYAPRPLGLNANQLEEFLELRNVSAQLVPLFDPTHSTNTWRLLDGVQFRFAEGTTLEPWSCALLVPFDPVYDPVSLQWFRSRYQVPTNVPIFGPFEGALANEGEKVGLYYPDKPQALPAPDAGYVPHVLVESVRYSPQPPWPGASLETGQSLHRIQGWEFGDDPGNWRAGAPTPGTCPGADTDLDGLPDEWELAYGLDPGSALGADGFDGDKDQDGASNGHEALAGTRPNDAGDVLRLDVANINPTACILEFNTQIGRLYSVERLAQFSQTNSWTTILESAPGTGSQWQLTDPANPDQPARFYRLRVVLQAQ